MMINKNPKAQIQRMLNNPAISITLLVCVVALIAYTAYYVTEAIREEPDFGGMITIRQANLGINGDSYSADAKLSRTKILKYITDERVLTDVAQKYHWNIPYKDMLANIDVKERLSSQNSYFVIANTKNAARSLKIARALSVGFLEEYRKQWNEVSRKKLALCTKRIGSYEKDLHDLKKLKERFQDEGKLRPLNTEIEMKALNEQLVEAQKQFFTAYAAYMTRMEEKRSNFRMELDMLSQVRTEDDNELINMRSQMAELDRQCEKLKDQMLRQRPNVYQMTMDYPKLTGLPNDIIYFYENIQNLQQIKLAMLLESIIEDKETMLDRERKKKTTIERLLDSKSCDVFLREGGR